MNNLIRRHRWILTAALAAVLSGLVPGRVLAAEPEATDPLAQAAAPQAAQRSSEPIVRELFVPFEDLHVLLEDQPRRVLLTRAEYEALLAKASAASDSTAPQPFALLSAEYDIRVEARRAVIRGELVVEVMAEGLQAVPLELSGAGLRDARLDGEPAPLGQSALGKLDLFVEGVGTHRLALDVVAPIETTAARQSLQVRLPEAPASTIDLVVPGDVEVQSGASVVSRRFVEADDATYFELSRSRGDLALVMTLNSRLQRQQQAVVARSVVVGEVTQAFERLHATVSFDVLHRSVRRLRLRVPEGFDVTHVESALLSRWSIAEQGPSQILTLQLREPTDDTVVVNLSAVRPIALNETWRFGWIEPLDVVGQVAVIGLLVEDRLRTESIASQRLLPLDTNVLDAALPTTLLEAGSDAPAMEKIAAFYAPQADFGLSARFVRPPAELAATSNVLLVVEETGMELQAGVSLLPKVERLFATDIVLPDAWQVTRVTGPDETPLHFERYASDDGRARVSVRLPGGLEPGQQVQLYVQARWVPAGWLDDWQSRQIVFPAIAIRGATRDMGAVAVEARGDFAVRPETLENLQPLDDAEKDQYGLSGVVTDLAYRYPAQPYRAEIVIERQTPRATARTYSFFRIEPGSLAAHYEMVYHIDQAAGRRLAFDLPKSTPAVLSVRGADGLGLKQYTSRVIGDTRRWTVVLEEAKQGDVRLLADFEQARSDVKADELVLPMAQAADVAYQSGLLAVEGSAQLDVRVETEARRVDVGELVDAVYQPGRRLLGVFGFVGVGPKVVARVFRHPQYGLPAAIGQRTTLTTFLAAEGVSQTAAEFALRAGAVFVEVELPPGSTLWSADLDDDPLKPQRKNDTLLINLPAAEDRSLRKLRIIYQTPVDAAVIWGRVELPAPRLKLRERGDSAVYEVPLADLRWDVYPPDGYRVVRSRGTVVSEELAPTEPAALAMIKSLYWIGGGVHGPFFLLPAVQSARESARRAADESAARMHGFAEKDMDYLTDDFATGAAPGADEPAMMPPAQPQAEPQEAPAESLTEPQPQREEMEAEQARPDVAADEDVETAAGERTAAPRDAKPRSSADGAELKRQEALARKHALARKLRGVASLKIDLPTDGFRGHRTTFLSLGEGSRLDLVVASQPRLKALGWGLTVLVLLIGVALTRRSVRAKVRFVVLVLIAATLIPLLPGGVPWAEPLNMAVYAASALIPYFLLVGMFRSLAARGSDDDNQSPESPATPAGSLAGGTASLLALILVVAGSGVAAGEDQKPRLGPYVIQVEAPPEPVVVPEDAIVVPYEPESEGEIDDVDQRLVPYRKYVELWNRAYPDKKIGDAHLPAQFALAGCQYRTRLADDEGLRVEGRLTIDVFSRQPVIVPLPLEGGVLVGAAVDGKLARLGTAPVAVLGAGDQRLGPQTNRQVNAPAQGQRRSGDTARVQPNAQQAALPPAAQQQAVQPPAQADQPATPVQQLAVPAPPRDGQVLVVRLEGEGRHVLELSMRLHVERQGGWRKISGRLPVGPAAGLSIVAPEANTEIQLGEILDRRKYETERAEQTIDTALTAPEGRIRLQWRPLVAAAEVDRGLTVASEAVVDLQEQGLRVIWQVQLEFPRGQRESFRLSVPNGYLVEQVGGPNVRGFQTAEREDGRRTIDVELLEPARDRETVTVRLWRQVALATEEATEAAVPWVGVEGAALQSGRVLLRRSPLLNVEVAATDGVSRTDVPETVVPGNNGGAETVVSSPLGAKPYQAYQFAGVPFSIGLKVKLVRRDVSAGLQNILRISERGQALESRVALQASGRPTFQAAISLPKGFRMEDISAPGAFHWSVTEDASERPLLSVRFETGQLGTTAIVIEGRIETADRSETVFALPQIAVRDVDYQSAQIAVQADPAIDVSAEELEHCETVLLRELSAWLDPKQRANTRLALRCRQGDYAGTLRLKQREPEVLYTTISNVRITDRAIEETILLDFDIRRAGIRRVSFILPRAMADATIRVPMLRQKTVEPVGNEQGEEIRVTLDLQDEMMRQLRVLVEQDRLLTAETHDVPIPRVETGTAMQRFVTIENAGRDEVVIGDRQGLEPVARQQKGWRWIKSMLGGHVTEAFLVVPGAKQVGMQYATKERRLVETAGARIGLAETDLIVDANGTYRGLQVYHLGNSTEQFLQVELPHGARLWTAEVAGEPVKPVNDPDAADGRHIRIPLVKTAAGDLDYEVVLKYGGALSMPAAGGTISFPLLRTLNVNVEMSQARLHLPEQFRWFDFGGTMHPVDDDAELIAGYVAYQNRLAKRLIDTMRHAGSFAKIRAASKLKSMKSKLSDDDPGVSGASSYEGTQSETLQKELREQSQLLEQAGAEITANLEQPAEEQADMWNRGRLNDMFESQSTGRARHVVEQLESNWKKTAPAAPKAGTELQFDSRWLKQNRLANAPAIAEAGRESRLRDKASQVDGKQDSADAPAKPAAPEVAKGKARARLEHAQTQSRGQQSEQQGPASKLDAVGRYQRKLQQEAQSGQESLDAGQAAADRLSRNVRSNRPAGPSGRVPQLADEARKRAVTEQERSGTVGIAGPAATGLSSLSVELPKRGQVYRFATPRGDVSVTARSVSKETLQTMRRLVGLGVVLLVGLALLRVGESRCRQPRLSSRNGSWLIGAGLIALVLGIFPVAAILAMIAGGLLKLR